MLTKSIMKIILTIASVLIIIGMFLMAWALLTAQERNVIKVFLDSGDTKPIKFEALSMVPGDEQEYSVKLMKSKADKFDLSFDFVENGDGELKKYARVKIIANDNAVYDDLLVNAFENDLPTVSVDFGTGKNTEIRIVYYLPIDVGNEAKNAEALFELNLRASNE